MDIVTGPLVIGAGACLCLFVMLVGVALVAFLVMRNKKGADTPAPSPTPPAPTTPPAPEAPPAPPEDRPEDVLAALEEAAVADVDHEGAQLVLGRYLALLASPSAPSGDARAPFDALADKIEGVVTTKTYNPSVLAEFGLDRMRILAEVNKTAHRFDTTSRVLIVHEGAERAVTLEQLWDAAMEFPDTVDLRPGQTFGTPTELAEEMLKLGRSR